jgi:thiamine biosynthesis lipoprotein
MKTATVFKKGLKLMGNHFEISVVADNEKWAFECIDAGKLLEKI